MILLKTTALPLKICRRTGNVRGADRARTNSIRHNTVDICDEQMSFFLRMLSVMCTVR